jgi:N-acyl-D-aspartate/D-glutamate deacylase
MSEGQARVTLDGLYTDEVISVQTKHPLSHFMTDTWYEPGSKQNEHLYSGFPRFLELSRDGQGPSIEETVHKMSGKNALRFGLRDRGFLKKGAFADVCVFELDKIKTFPEEFPEGIREVFINGRHVIRNGELERTAFYRAGRAMRVFGK